jgi:hypothetical protein
VLEKVGIHRVYLAQIEGKSEESTDPYPEL